MEQKFIITQDGFLRMGLVRMHRHLLQEGDVCIGGGYYQFDYIANRIILDRESYDYGRPQWNRIDGTLRVPMEYKGMGIVYRPSSRSEETVDLFSEFKIEYV
jgi:hypothetical protein